MFVTVLGIVAVLLMWCAVSLALALLVGGAVRVRDVRLRDARLVARQRTVVVARR